MNQLSTCKRGLLCKRGIWKRVYGNPELGELRNQGAILTHYCELPRGQVIDTLDAPLNCRFFQERMGRIVTKGELNKVSKKTNLGKVKRV